MTNPETPKPKRSIPEGFSIQQIPNDHDDTKLWDMWCYLNSLPTNSGGMEIDELLLPAIFYPTDNSIPNPSDN